MKLEFVKPGLRVVVEKLGTTTGMMINKKHLDVRAVGVKGIIGSYVPGHGGDVWYIVHDDGNVGAYVFDEFEITE